MANINPAYYPPPYWVLGYPSRDNFLAGSQYTILMRDEHDLEKAKSCAETALSKFEVVELNSRESGAHYVWTFSAASKGLE